MHNIRIYYLGTVLEKIIEEYEYNISEQSQYSGFFLSLVLKKRGGGGGGGEDMWTGILLLRNNPSSPLSLISNAVSRFEHHSTNM